MSVSLDEKKDKWTEAIQKDGFMGVVAGGLQACAVGITVAMLSGLTEALICRP